MSNLGAAPTTDADDAATSSARPSTPAATGLRPLDRAVAPEASTGNKNLDLLLEMQGKPGDEARRATPRSDAAASAAAAALGSLRAKAADGHSAKPAVQPFEGMMPLAGNGRAAAQPPERREWIGQPAGGAGGSAGAGGGGGGGGHDGRREPESAGAQLGNDNLIRALPRDVIVFLRDHRYWLLGGLGLLAVLGAAIKSFSRRI